MLVGRHPIVSPLSPHNSSLCYTPKFFTPHSSVCCTHICYTQVVAVYSSLSLHIYQFAICSTQAFPTLPSFRSTFKFLLHTFKFMLHPCRPVATHSSIVLHIHLFATLPMFPTLHLSCWLDFGSNLSFRFMAVLR